MKLLLLSDLHGEVPDSVKGWAEEKEYAACLYLGDLCRGEEIRAILFQNFPRLQVPLPWEEFYARFVPQEVMARALESMWGVVDYLDGLEVPVYLIEGNADFSRSFVEKAGYALPGLSLDDALEGRRNLHLLRNRREGFSGYCLMGHCGARLLHHAPPEGEWRGGLEELFSGAEAPAIFLGHNPPWDTLDQIDDQRSFAHGRRAGDKVYREFLEVHQPLLWACGHIHEAQGAVATGRTTVVNPGHGRGGQAALVSLGEEGVSGVEFLRSKEEGHR